MKTIFKSLFLIAVIAVCGTSACYAKKTNDGKAIMTLPTEVWDFGNIREKKGPVSHEFEFTNTGNGNLVIINATAQCGCTRPEFPKSPVAPGKKNKITVTYNPLGRPGAFEKTVTLTTNGKPKKVRLKIRGTVIPD